MKEWRTPKTNHKYTCIFCDMCVLEKFIAENQLHSYPKHEYVNFKCLHVVVFHFCEDLFDKSDLIDTIMKYQFYYILLFKKKTCDDYKDEIMEEFFIHVHHCKAYFNILCVTERKSIKKDFQDHHSNLLIPACDINCTPLESTKPWLLWQVLAMILLILLFKNFLSSLMIKFHLIVVMN